MTFTRWCILGNDGQTQMDITLEEDSNSGDVEGKKDPKVRRRGGGPVILEPLQNKRGRGGGLNGVSRI